MAQAMTCQACEERPANLLISSTDTGDTQRVCLPCAPFLVQAIWNAAGLPPLTIEVAGTERADAADVIPDETPTAPQLAPVPLEPDPEGDAAWEASAAPERPTGGRKRSSGGSR